jgi:two-component system OmpR family response regulator
LQASWHPVQLSETAEEALKAARSGGASVPVLDRMLHGENGLSIVEKLRSEGNRAPVLVISALSSVDEWINGLKAEGDDFWSSRSQSASWRHGSRRSCAAAAIPA